MKLAYASTALVLAVVLATSALAQIGGGQSGMSTGARATNVRAFEELRGFGMCFARQQRKDALAIMEAAPGSPEETAALKKSMYGERTSCMFGGDRMRFSPIYARGIVAEGLLKSGGVPGGLRLTAPSPAEAKDLHGAARCYVAGHRGAAEGVLVTAPGSSQETSAVAGLWNDFRSCMPGFKVRLNAPWIRFLLAEALLRLAPEKQQAV